MNVSRKPIKHLSEIEYERLLAHCGKVNSIESLLIELMVRCGARTDEMVKLTKASFSSTNLTVYILGSKGSDSDFLPIDEDFYQRLEKGVLARLPNDKTPLTDLLSPSKVRRGHHRAMIKAWEHVRTACFGDLVTLSIHGLRHTFGVNVQRLAKDIRITKRALRHRDIHNTMRYVDVVDKSERDPMILAAVSGLNKLRRSA